MRTNKPIPKLPLSYLMELSALMMENRTLKEAFDQEYAWHELLEEGDARGEEMTEQHPENYRMPGSAIRALTSFQRWYFMKKPCAYNISSLPKSRFLIYSLWDGELSSLSLPEVRARAELRNSTLYID